MKGALSVRETVLFGILGGLLVAVQVALAVLPNIELVSMLIIAYTLAFGLRALWPTYLFVLVEGLIFGTGLWLVNYLYVWAILVFLTLLLRRVTEHWLALVLLSAFFGLIFGGLCAIPYLFIGGPKTALAFWLAGIPFDLLHCGGNAAAGFLILPTAKLLRQLWAKSGIARP